MVFISFDDEEMDSSFLNGFDTKWCEYVYVI